MGIYVDENVCNGCGIAEEPMCVRDCPGDLMVLRPLAHVAEADCERFANAMGFPIIPCDLCGSQEGLQRQQIKAMLDEWERRHPGRRSVMFKAIRNVNPSHLADGQLFDFIGLAPVDGTNDR